MKKIIVKYIYNKTLREVHMASKHVEKIKALYKENKKSSLIWYLVLRTFVIITMVLSFFRGDYSSVFLCILTLILFLIP